MKFYLGNLPFTVTEQEIRDFFRPLEIGQVIICTDRETGRARGFGFAEIPRGFDRVIVDYSGLEFGGRRILVSEALEKKPGSRPVRTASPERAPEPRFDKPKKRGGGGRGNRRDRDDY